MLVCVLSVIVALHSVGCNAFVAQDYESFHDIVQLSDITRPCIVGKQVDSIGIDMLYIHLMVLAYLSNKVLSK